MVTKKYRKANELADLLDFDLAALEGARKMGLPTEGDERDIAKLRSDLAKQERIDGKPADPREQRQGFLGAI